jgi:hypothetical protein
MQSDVVLSTPEGFGKPLSWQAAQQLEASAAPYLNASGMSHLHQQQQSVYVGQQ